MFVQITSNAKAFWSKEKPGVLFSKSTLKINTFIYNEIFGNIVLRQDIFISMAIESVLFRLICSCIILSENIFKSWYLQQEIFRRPKDLLMTSIDWIQKGCSVYLTGRIGIEARVFGSTWVISKSRHLKTTYLFIRFTINVTRFRFTHFECQTRAAKIPQNIFYSRLMGGFRRIAGLN